MLTAQARSSGVDTVVLPWIGARGGRTFALGGDEGPLAGLDVGLAAGGGAEGTPQVRTTQTWVALEGRGLWAPGRDTSTFTAFMPYAFAGASLGVGLLHQEAFGGKLDDPVLTWAARVGGGAEIEVHHLVARVELGAGVRDLRFEVSSSISAGIAF